MRVLFIISDLDLGGAQKQVVEISRQLVRHGHEAAIFTLNNVVPRSPDLEGSGVELVVEQKRSKLDARVLGKLRRFIRDWRPDIIHGFLFDGDVYGRIAAIGTGVPVLNSERSSHYTISMTQRIAHIATKPFVHGVVANSHEGSAFAQKLYGYDPAHMHVVWNGMRVEDFERQARSDREYKREIFGTDEVKVACFIGAIKPAKDYHLAVDVAQQLLERAPGWRVLFLGDSLSAPNAAGYKAGVHSDTSGYKDEVMAHYRRLGIADRAIFAGTRKDLPAIVKQCDVLYVTSAWEGFPNSVLEAMVLGVPVVSTDYSDIRRILPERQVVKKRDPALIAEAILTAELDHDLIAAQQKRWVLANASIEKATQDLERVYERYIRHEPVRAPA
jgi:glycosyltransferase involved in cell wall biosynthesis